MESQNHLGWKRPLRSSSPTANPAVQSLPLNPVPKCYNDMSFKDSLDFSTLLSKALIGLCNTVRGPCISSKFTVTPGLQRQSFCLCLFASWLRYYSSVRCHKLYISVFLSSIFLLSLVWISRIFFYWQVYIYTKRCILFYSQRIEKPLAHICVSHASIPECI